MLHTERRTEEPRVERAERQKRKGPRPPGEQGKRVVREPSLGARREHHEEGRRI